MISPPITTTPIGWRKLGSPETRLRAAGAMKQQHQHRVDAENPDRHRGRERSEQLDLALDLGRGGAHRDIGNRAKRDVFTRPGDGDQGDVVQRFAVRLAVRPDLPCAIVIPLVIPAPPSAIRRP